jgi:hypothetical protein
MIPLRDTARSKTIPFVNYLLIITCGIVFLFEITAGESLAMVFQSYGVIPSEVRTTLLSGQFSADVTLTLVTSLFLHGGWIHLIGNMLYLYVFGDNVEDRLGHKGFLVFYMLSGIGASLTQVLFQPESNIPLVGASGAIAGVLGAYFLLFPRARILTVIPLVIFFPVVELSAFFFLGFWFLLQFVQASLSFGTSMEGGVAWWAHAGGFVAGAFLLPVFLLLRKL